jgi:hypothetical protein
MASVALQTTRCFERARRSWLAVVGRLREGATVAQADAEMRVTGRQLNPPARRQTGEERAVLPMHGV